MLKFPAGSFSESSQSEDDSDDNIGHKIRLQRRAAIEEFRIEVDKRTRTFEVIGEGLKNFTHMTNWE